jgi:hypothetical protein
VSSADHENKWFEQLFTELNSEANRYTGKRNFKDVKISEIVYISNLFTEGERSAVLHVQITQTTACCVDSLG